MELIRSALKIEQKIARRDVVRTKPSAPTIRPRTLLDMHHAMRSENEAGAAQMLGLVKRRCPCGIIGEIQRTTKLHPRESQSLRTRATVWSTLCSETQPAGGL